MAGWGSPLAEAFQLPWGRKKRREIKARVAMTLGPGRGRGHQQGSILATTFRPVYKPPALGTGSAAQGSWYEPKKLMLISSLRLVSLIQTLSSLPSTALAWCAPRSLLSASFQAWLVLCDFASPTAARFPSLHSVDPDLDLP